jgi:hypothetical protein
VHQKSGQEERRTRWHFVHSPTLTVPGPNIQDDVCELPGDRTVQHVAVHTDNCSDGLQNQRQRFFRGFGEEGYEVRDDAEGERREDLGRNVSAEAGKAYWMVRAGSGRLMHSGETRPTF